MTVHELMSILKDMPEDAVVSVCYSSDNPVDDGSAVEDVMYIERHFKTIPDAKLTLATHVVLLY